MTPLPSLHLITDGERIGEVALRERLAAAVRGGLELVQLREKHLSDQTFRRLALELREALPGLRWIANRRPEIVRELDLAGVHVGGDLAVIERARESVGSERWVGYSAHSESEAREAFARGADYVYLAPVFPPVSKSSHLEPLGITGLKQACASLPPAVFALGGIAAENLAELRRAGAAGGAVIGSILDAACAETATRELRSAWEHGVLNSSPEK